MSAVSAACRPALSDGAHVCSSLCTCVLIPCPHMAHMHSSVHVDMHSCVHPRLHHGLLTQCRVPWPTDPAPRAMSVV